MGADPGGDLGLILGAVVGALIDQGYGLPEIQRWVEQAAQTRKAARAAVMAMEAANNDRQ